MEIKQRSGYWHPDYDQEIECEADPSTTVEAGYEVYPYNCKVAISYMVFETELGIGCMWSIVAVRYVLGDKKMLLQRLPWVATSL